MTDREYWESEREANNKSIAELEKNLAVRIARREEIEKELTA